MMRKCEIKKIPKDDHPRRENIASQPFHHEAVFNEPHVITESWYPVCPAGEIGKMEVKSFTILHHRFAIWRGKSGELHAVDSFCPHMGADLGNGSVVGENLQCYFHHWTYSPEGKCANHRDDKANLRSYPVEEKYGHIWIYAGEKAAHKVPNPPGLQGKGIRSIFLRHIKLFAHHHVMMAGGIDLQHFKTVHKVDIKFDYVIEEKESDVSIWNLEGKIPPRSLFLKFGAWLTGGSLKYQALFAGGTIVSLTYGNDLKFRGKGFTLPAVHILWGCKPVNDGVSEVDVFLVMPEYRGLFAPLKKIAHFLFSTILLWALHDDDVRAFPHMRFNLNLPTEHDKSVMDLVNRINKLKISSWTKDRK